MTAKNKNTKVETIESVGEAVSKTEVFFKTYGKTLAYVGGGLVAIAAIIILYIQFYANPLKQEAQAQTFTAEQYFRAEDYDKALNGDGNALGFSQIIDEYGAKGGKAVYLYAGICQLQLGNAAEAIEYLNQYRTDDAILTARAIACTGDAYSILDNNAEALKFYIQAADYADNVYAAAYLLKAGIICEEMGKPQEALVYYQRVKDNYPTTPEGYEIDKYITRIKVAE
ncbi:MAG: tetratricopeptide repeat protein [Bacteroidales bacterium]|nr:tetratricopeptide repeat protein [Bacteroidales bacterium]